jgi:hypothetical protein
MILVNSELVRAIRERRLIAFVYKDRHRVVEPHDYGGRRGVASLLGFQIEGESHSTPEGWKQFDVEGIRELRVLERGFSGSRTDREQHHRPWDTLFARVT